MLLFLIKLSIYLKTIYLSIAFLIPFEQCIVYQSIVLLPFKILLISVNTFFIHYFEQNTLLSVNKRKFPLR